MDKESTAYPFDAPFFEVPFNAMPGADEPVVVWHRLRKPTLAELLERDKDVRLTIREITPREDHIDNNDDEANARLWDKIALSIKGYRGMDVWQDVTDLERNTMRAGHKVAAIRAFYSATASIDNLDASIGLSADLWRVKQSIGNDPEHPLFEIVHVLREPSESERTSFRRRATRISQIKGLKKPQTKITIDLSAYVELYDQLVTDIENGSVNDKSFMDTSDKAAFLVAIDPTWKRIVVQRLMDAIEASLLD